MFVSIEIKNVKTETEREFNLGRKQPISSISLKNSEYAAHISNSRPREVFCVKQTAFLSQIHGNNNCSLQVSPSALFITSATETHCLSLKL